MPESGADPAKQLEIRKYPNRRYYDATRSRHVTLEEIYDLIRNGYEVRVIDSKTGQDITAKVLAQIMIDVEPLKLGVFPVPLLHRLLRSNEQLITDFVRKYFNQALSNFLNSQRNFEQYLRQSMGLTTSAPTMADLTKLMWGPVSPGLWSTNGGQVSSEPATDSPPSPADPAASAANAPPPPPPSARSAPDDQEDLRGMVAALRKEVESLRADRSSRRAKPASRRRAR